jgi:hypothetical protein
MISFDRLQAAVPSALEQTPELLDEMIARAVAFIEMQTNRVFSTPREVTYVLTGQGSAFLPLPEPMAEPLEDSGGALISVVERSAPGGTATVVDVDAVDIRAGGKSHTLVRHSPNIWTKGYEYTVAYLSGYVVNTGPRDVEQLVIDMVALRLARIGREGLSGETIGGYSYTVAAVHAFDDGDLNSIPGGMRTVRAWQRLVLA